MTRRCDGLTDSEMDLHLRRLSFQCPGGKTGLHIRRHLMDPDRQRRNEEWDRERLHQYLARIVDDDGTERRLAEEQRRVYLARIAESEVVQ